MLRDMFACSSLLISPVLPCYCSSLIVSYLLFCCFATCLRIDHCTKLESASRKVGHQQRGCNALWVTESKPALLSTSPCHTGSSRTWVTPGLSAKISGSLLVSASRTLEHLCFALSMRKNRCVSNSRPLPTVEDAARPAFSASDFQGSSRSGFGLVSVGRARVSPACVLRAEW